MVVQAPDQLTLRRWVEKIGFNRIIVILDKTKNKIKRIIVINMDTKPNHIIKMTTLLRIPL